MSLSTECAAAFPSLRYPSLYVIAWGRVKLRINITLVSISEVGEIARVATLATSENTSDINL